MKRLSLAVLLLAVLIVGCSKASDPTDCCEQQIAQADQLASKGQWEAAYRYTKNIPDDASLEPSELYLVAIVELQSGDAQKAYDKFKQVHQRASGGALAQKTVDGNTVTYSGNLESALVYPALIGLGVSSLQSRRFEGACSWLKSAKDKSPDAGDAFFWIARLQREGHSCPTTETTQELEAAASRLGVSKELRPKKVSL